MRVIKSLLASVAINTGFLASSLVQIFNMLALPMAYCYTDNQSLADTLKTERVTSDRRSRVDVVRYICWIDGKSHVADALTKRGAFTGMLMEVPQS